MQLIPRLALGAALVATAGVLAMQAWRVADEAAAGRAWQHLAQSQPDAGARFDPAMVEHLPDPARRFFRFAIQPGARLGFVVDITMHGELSLGTKADPGYQPMRARQILAAPDGLVWRVQAGEGLMRITGSDGMDAGRSWTRFWLLGTVPIVRAGGDADHLRSSFGRVVAEAMFWSPAALLPQRGVRWEAIDADTARATVTAGGMTQQVTVRVAASGQPVWVSMPRWTNANPQGVFRLQPFGGELSDFREVQGYRVPFRVDGGNFFGTADYFPFYRARLDDWRPAAPG